MGLTNAVMNSQGVTEEEAEELINEQLDIIRDNGMDYSDVENACYELGVEADYEMELISRLAG